VVVASQALPIGRALLAWWRLTCGFTKTVRQLADLEGKKEIAKRLAGIWDSVGQALSIYASVCVLRR
jgi:hypothetical protein